MAFNLLEAVQDQLNDNILGKVAGVAGIGGDAAGSAMKSFLPTLLGGIINKGSTASGAGDLLDMVTKGGHNGGMLDNLGSVLGGDTKGLMDTGNGLLSGIFGNNLSSIFNILGKVTGLTRGSSGSLMGLLAPIAMNVIGRQIKKKSLNAGGLKDMLSGQRGYVQSGIPQDARSILGFADTGKTTTTTSTTHATETKSGGGLMKWLLPLALLLAALWFLTRMGGCGGTGTTTAVDADADKTTTTTTTHSSGTHTHADGTVHSNDAHTHSAGDAAGKVVDKAAEIGSNAADGVKGAADKVAAGVAGAAGAAATYMVDAAGNLVDGDGKILFKKGDFMEKDGYYVDKDGNKIGQILGKVKDAVVGAAEKTADAFKNLFSGMVTKKAGSESTYSLTKIQFDPENHKITSFSKAEVEGLAAALKANPTGKIQVQATTNDAGGKKVASLRAKVIEDMLVTLGVGKKQISSQGMDGSGETYKIVIQ